MFDDSFMLEPEFSAAISKKSMESAESKHVDIEKLRKISMLAGLTNSSQELNKICKLNPKEFQQALEFGLTAYEHYKNLQLLMESSILRIYAVAVNNPTWTGRDNAENLEKIIENMLSSKSQEMQH